MTQDGFRPSGEIEIQKALRPTRRAQVGPPETAWGGGGHIRAADPRERGTPPRTAGAICSIYWMMSAYLRNGPESFFAFRLMAASSATLTHT